MQRKYYPAEFSKEEGDGAIGVVFPDFPGCVTAGNTLEEAFVAAHEALVLHVNGMIEDDLPLPEATEMTRVDRDATTVAVMLVGVTLPGKAKRINITLDEALLEEIDRVTKNRSRFLADAARDVLARLASG